MSDPAITRFGIALVVLILMSAFFSGTETALMRVNRYRMRHAARAGKRGAQLAEKLLQKPDRLIGAILFGNNIVNIAATSLATIIAIRLGGESAVAYSTVVLTIVILLFAEVAPKTLAAMRAESIAYGAAYFYGPFIFLAFPVLFLINGIANFMLRLIGVDTAGDGLESMSREELRTVVLESEGLLPKRRRTMLLRILDLEKVSVEDIMVPRNEIVGLDLDDPWEDVLAQLQNVQHTLLPVYRDGIDNVLGILHVRKALKPLAAGALDAEILVSLLTPPYYVPEAAPLNHQMLNFQAGRRRFGLVVDEYGDIQGLVTLQDLLEEIVGDFTTDPAEIHEDVHPEGPGRYLVSASANVRELNRTMRWELPTGGAKTLNGLIQELLETIPPTGTRLEIAGYSAEIVQASASAIKTVRITVPARFTAPT